MLRQHLQVFDLSSKLHRNAVPQLNKCCIKKSSLKVVSHKITFKKHYRLMLSLRLKSTRQQPAKTTKGIPWNRVPGLLSRYILNRLPAIFFGLGGGGGGSNNTKSVFLSTLYIITDSFIAKLIICVYIILFELTLYRQIVALSTRTHSVTEAS